MVLFLLDGLELTLASFLLPLFFLLSVEMTKKRTDWLNLLDEQVSWECCLDSFSWVSWASLFGAGM